MEVADRVELITLSPTEAGSQPAWADQKMTQTVECYRRDFNMNTPMSTRTISEHPGGRMEELTVSESRLDYMSPMDALRPRLTSEWMNPVPVKVDYMDTESIVQLRRVDPDTGSLIPSIDDEMQRELIVKLIERLLPDSEYGPGTVERLTREEYMNDLWVPVFTHKSYDPNMNRNYEKFEYIGDAVMGLAFRAYLIRMFPELTEGEYTAMSSHYLSTPEQAKMAEKLQLIAAIRSNVIPDRPIAEDVMEAFYGALYYIVPTRVINKFTEQIYDDVELDISYRHQDPKTNVLQYFERRHLDKPIERHEILSDGNTVTSLVISQRDTMNRLLEILPDLDYQETNAGFVIATGNPSSIRRSANLSAYNKMYETISTIGTFELEAPRLQQRYVQCLDRVYGDTHEDYTPIVIGGGAGSTTMAIQAKNKSTEQLDNIVTMQIPVASNEQRRNVTRTFLESICRAIPS